VYPGAGSHDNQFVQWLYLGHIAQTGFGCDDTRGPTRYEQTQVVVAPAEPTGPPPEELPGFVVNRGGEYCFIPSLSALRWLSELDT
jgi:hypothetical protein